MDKLYQIKTINNSVGNRILHCFPGPSRGISAIHGQQDPKAGFVTLRLVGAQVSVLKIDSDMLKMKWMKYFPDVPSVFAVFSVALFHSALRSELKRLLLLGCRPARLRRQRPRPWRGKQHQQRYRSLWRCLDTKAGGVGDGWRFEGLEKVRKWEIVGMYKLIWIICIYIL